MTLYEWCKQNKRLYIIEQWNKDKNDGVSVFTIKPFSGRKIHWVCEKGHEWLATVDARTRRLSGCPYCSNQKILSGYNDFATLRPELMKEWNFDKNIDIEPDEVAEYSHYMVWWRCIKGHEWESTIANRSRGYNCPYCSNQRVLVGYNDLATKNPLLSTEWDYDKNGELNPTDVTVATSKKVWWKCIRGHEWKDTINHRNNGRGCPLCNKGLKTSFPEQAVFYYVSRLFKDAKSRFIDFGFELDIYIPCIRLGIEYDGGIYHNDIRREQKKIEECIKHSIKLIKIREPECCELLENNDLKVFKLKNHSHNELQRTIIELIEYIKREYSVYESIGINLNTDNIKILQMIGIYEKENSVLLKRPELAKEWDYQKNGDLRPEMIGSKSSQKVWWLCPNCNKSWKQSPSARRSIGHCPKCSNEVVNLGVNDLVTKRPELAKEWDYSKNSANPEDFRNTSDTLVWWICSKCKSEWEELISSRNRKIINAGVARCPSCDKGFVPRPKPGWMNRELVEVENSLAEKYPELTSEWDYEGNGEIKPENVTYASTYKAHWICKKGHKYVASVGNRTNQKSGCPYCSNQKLLVGFNDFATTCSDAAIEWMYNRNYPDTPQSIIGGNKKRWWKCRVCEFEWEASPTTRKSGCGCPNCARNSRIRKSRKKVGQYDLKTQKLIRIFNSVKEAEESIHNKNIGSVCNGHRKSAGGFYWQHIED